MPLHYVDPRKQHGLRYAVLEGFWLAEQVYAGWGDYRAKTDPIGRRIPVFRLKPR